MRYIIAAVLKNNDIGFYQDTLQLNTLKSKAKILNGLDAKNICSTLNKNAGVKDAFIFNAIKSKTDIIQVIRKRYKKVKKTAKKN